MFNELLKKYRKLARLTQTELAEKLEYKLGSKYTYSSIQSYERGVNPKIEVIEALAEILNIPEQFLFDDSDHTIEKIVQDEIKKNPEKYQKKMTSNIEVQRDILKVPLYVGYVGAGSTGLIDTLNVQEYLYVDVNSIKKSFKNKNIQALEVIGDSMSPYVDCCDIVLFSQLQQSSHLVDGKYIIQTCRGVMVKNLSFKTNGNIIISSCNPIYPSEEINCKESQEVLEILGIVVGRILKS